METLKIDIVNPKAKRIIEELADLKLIHIRKEDKHESFQSLLKNLRSKKVAPSLKSISKEVEAARAKRYGKKAN